MRGEQLRLRSPRLRCLGPSPRARGADESTVLAGRLNRTIPACAGSRTAGCSPVGRPEDHPRVRGEQSTSPQRWPTTCGPSPRARGAATDGRQHRHARGTIPACAGSRTDHRARSRRPADHPRVRGEQCIPADLYLAGEGPSPRARGAVRDRTGHLCLAGTIPACAGSSEDQGRGDPGKADHPRVRGEQSGPQRSGCPPSGPSPRARGAVRRARPQRHGQGTIPACAGSRRCTPPRRRVMGDHPRVRGEQHRSDDWPIFHIGPSPRARGAVLCRQLLAAERRTIPACAGSRPERGGWWGIPRDHPRVRGEQTN